MAAVGFTLWPDLEHLPTVVPVLEAADYVEVTPETLWGPGGRRNRYHGIARALADAGTPLVAHGVGIDPASRDDERRRTWLSRLRRDAAELGFRWVSDHLGTTCIDGEPIALPVPAPASMDRLSRTLDQLAAATGAPAAIENSAWYAYPGQALDEPAQLTQALGARHHLVLDVHNLWTNAINLGFDPMVWLDRAPLDRVIELHVSGGTWAPDAWSPERRLRLDSHDDAVPDEVWQLVRAVVPRCPRLRGATLERIEGTVQPADVPGLLHELTRLRALVAGHGQPLGPAPTVPGAPPAVEPSPPRSAAEQAVEAALAALVRAPGDDPGSGVAHRLVVKLRFSRLLRGDDAAQAWFEADPAAFTEAFRAFHEQVPCRETPWGEAEAWRGWRAG